MALQSLLNDPNISLFLEKIPQKQQIITLKELIYIGIKIVSDSFNKQQVKYEGKSRKKQFQNFFDKQNRNSNQFQRHQQNKPVKEKNKNKKQALNINSSQINSKFQRQTQKSQGPHQIQSTLLRQISKIRMQLQNLTNKVYDHCFENQNYPNQQDSQLQQSFNAKNNQQLDQFNYGYDMPTFSPPKNNYVQKHKKTVQANSNPFSKQKNNFFVTDPKQNYTTQNNPLNFHNNKLSYVQSNNPTFSKKNNQHAFVERNRAKSNIMHMDDTQIRQALYKQQSEIQQNDSNFYNRVKKSQSLIQKKHQQKKKDQENYFYNLAVDKQRIQQLEKIKKSKSQINQPERDITDNSLGKGASQPNLYKKKVKSKIKKLVQRDRLRYQQKISQYNFKKGFQQYEYSANQFQEDQQNSQNEQSQVQNQKEYKKSEQKNIRSNKKNMEDSPKAEFSQEIEVSNANFGFYSSQEHGSPNSIQQNTFSNNQNIQEQDNINICSNSSSFSEFSMSGSSRRQVGKISRRKHE